MMAMTDNSLNTSDWAYQTQDVIMVPYREDGNRFFPETFMVSLYQRMQQQDLVNLIFPGMGITHLHKFIAFVNTHPFLVGFVRNPATGEIVDTAGFGYITESDGVDGARKAAFGFGFFKEWHGTKEVRSLGWFFLAFWMKNLKIDVLFGMTLKANRLARNFSYNFGFRGHADIPKLFFRNGELQDATIMYLLREDFDPLFDQWREEYVYQPGEEAVAVGG